MTAFALSDDPSGPECARVLRAVATARKMPVVELVRRTWGVRYPADVIKRLAVNHVVRPRTVQLVRAIAACGVDVPLPPPPERPDCARFRQPVPVAGFPSGRARRQAISVSIAEREKARIEAMRAARFGRTPCPRCAIRADIGCPHAQPERLSP